MLAASLLPPNIEHTNENIITAMSKLRYPVLATVKLDGIRALRMNGTLLSRRLKPIPNKSIRDRSLILPGGYDMELWNPEMSYNEIESIVMSREHKDSDKIQFRILDVFNHECYHNRCQDIDEWYRFVGTSDNYSWEYPVECLTPNELFLLFLSVESGQGEGICFRTPNSPYKQGRSTLKEQYLVKLARYIRTELTIIDFEEQMENANKLERNRLGYIDRSTFGANMYGKNTLGAFVCTYNSSDGTPITITVGTGVGLTDKLRKEIWLNRDKYLGKTIVVKHKPCGMKNKLRHPIFIGWRNEIDK
jgi:DNA ligase-1